MRVAGGGLDLDHIGAEVGQDGTGGGDERPVRHLDHTNTFKWARHVPSPLDGDDSMQEGSPLVPGDNLCGLGGYVLFPLLVGPAAPSTGARVDLVDLVDQTPGQRGGGVDAGPAEGEERHAMAAHPPGDARRAAGTGDEPEAHLGQRRPRSRAGR